MKRRTHLPSSCHQDSQQLSAAGVNTKTCLAAELMTLHQVWSLQPVNKHGMAVGKCLDSRLFALLNVGNCKKKMHVFLDHLPICRQEIAIFEWRCPPFWAPQLVPNPPLYHLVPSRCMPGTLGGKLQAPSSSKVTRTPRTALGLPLLEPQAVDFPCARSICFLHELLWKCCRNGGPKQ